MEHEGTNSTHEIDTILDIKDLAKSIPGSDQPLMLFEHISLSLNRGQSLAIQGSSGAGKSTLLACLAGITPIDHGAITLLGQDLARLNADQRAHIRRDHVGFIFQNFQLLPHLNALENVTMALEISGTSAPEAIKMAQDALDHVGLSARMHQKPHQLSGGEQQRVAIARAVCRKPAIIFADEPTGNLDPATSEQIMKLLIEAQKEHNSAIVMVTHDDALASLMDQSLKLWQKNLVAA